MINKRKVLQIVGDSSGGIRKHIHDIFFGLAHEFDFHYIASPEGDAQFSKDMPLLLTKGIHFYGLPIIKKPSVTDLYNIFAIYKYIKQHKISVVHGHGAKGGLYARVAGKMAGCKVIYTPHGGVVHNMFGRIESHLYRVVERFLCLLTDLLVFESHYTEKSFNDKFGCRKVKKVVNYNGVAIPPEVGVKKINPVGSAVKKIGVFGIMREEKGQDIAYDAIHALLKQGVNLELHFFGDGPLKSLLMKQAERDGITHAVVFHGYVTDVHVHMLDMDFILIPSRFESFGYVALEAALAGKLIISARVGGLAEVLDDKSCLFFEADNVEDLIINVKLALSDSFYMYPLVLEYAFDRAVTNFSMQKMIAFIQGTYNNV